MNKIQKAVFFAVKRHRKQLRKGSGFPYIVHPLGVMKYLMEHNASENAIIAGVLHDTLEDTKTTYLGLRIRFGKKVADIVKFCSENKDVKDWKARKQGTINKLIWCNDKDCLDVALADKLNNLTDIYNEHNRKGFWNRFNMDYKSQKWYYGELGKVIKKKQPEMSVLYDYMYKKVFNK